MIPLVARALLLAVLLLAPAPSWAATWWVSYLGNNANPGTEALPFRDVQFAFGQSSPGTFRPAYGDTIKIVPHPTADMSAYHWQATVPDEEEPLFNPNPTGTANQYLNIESSVPGTTVYLNCNPITPSENVSPCFGAFGRNFISYNGVSPAPNRQLGVAFTNSNNGRLWNSTIDLGPRTAGPNGNYWALSCHGTGLGFSENFDFYNVRMLNALNTDGLPSSGQCGGFGHFRCRNITLRNFEIDNAGTGIDDKEGGQGNVYEKGRITRIGGNAILIVNLGTASSNTNSNISNLTFRQLLIVDADTAVKINLSTQARTVAGITINNITAYDVHKGLVSTDLDEYVDAVAFFNNLIVVDTASRWQSFEVSGAIPWPDYLSDFNAYRVLGGVTQGFIVNGSTAEVLGTAGGSGEWRDRATTAIAAGFLDLNSVTTDPAFAGASLTYADPSTNWIPSVGSGLRTAGSATGLVGGAATWIGAFTSTTDQIGLEVTVAPSPYAPRRRPALGVFGLLEDLERVWALPAYAPEEAAYVLH